MPTIILVDTSLSMSRPISDESFSRLTLAKEGLESLFSYFEQVFPLEYIGLMSFSSTCVLINPFTREHSELRESLKLISITDRTNFHSALVSLTDVVIKEWGVFVPIQVILITDGLIANPSNEQECFCFPFPCQLHVICIANEDEDTNIDKIAKFTGIDNSYIYTPSTLNKVTSESVRDCFLSLAKTVFYPYTGVLKCGHLQCDFSLSPSPRMTQTTLDIASQPNHRFTNPYAVKDFPCELIICGFVDIGVLLAPAVYSKHFLIDAETTQDGLNKLLKTLQQETEVNENGTDKTSINSKPSFRVLLHGSLKCEAKVALVQLSDNWFGLLSSAAASSKKSNLILTVFFPDADIPWLGSLSYLGPKIIGTDPRLTEANNKSLFPVSVPHTMSYQAQSNLYWAKEGGLQNDFTKLLRYSHKLPEKEASLVKELNKLRQTVLTYSFPGLIEAICHILSVEESNTSNPQARAILQRCIQFLTTNQNPQDKLVTMSYK